MEKNNSVLKEKKKLITRLNRNSKIYKNIINAIQEKKGESIVTLDLKKIDEAVADYFVVCEARSNIQVKAIAGFIIEKIEEECNEKPFRTEIGDYWTLIDYVNIVVHIFQHELRVHYNLEALWADAQRMEH